MLYAVRTLLLKLERLGDDAFGRALEHVRKIIMEVALNNALSCLDKNGKELKREAFAMAKRFRDTGKAYFEFITTSGIGPTNNLAEQAVRQSLAASVVESQTD